MKLTLLFDHRFNRTGTGDCVSTKHYDFGFFQERYLGVFEEIDIVARVVPTSAVAVSHGATEGPGVRVRPLPMWNGALGAARNYFRIKRSLRDLLGKESAVIAVVPGVLGEFAHVELTRQCRPYAVEVVGDPRDAFAPGAMKHPLRSLIRWQAARQLRRQCSAAAAAMYVTEQALQSRYPCPGHTSGVSDVRLPDEALAVEPRSREHAGPARRLLLVGSLEQMFKGADVLIEAVAQCMREGLMLELTIVGDGRHRAELESHARDLGVAHRVTFAGWIPSGVAVRQQLDGSDLFVAPSRTEGLPRALVEAMARALPCIGTHVGGIPELLPSEDLVPPSNPHALAAKIREVSTNPVRLALMSARNLAKAHQYRDEILREKRLQFYRCVRERTEQWLRARR